MLVYILLATFFIILALSERRLSTNAGAALWCLCFVLLVLFDGLRWGNGTDWENYFYFYRDCLTSRSEFDSLFEPGYIYVNQLLRSITENYTFFLVLHAFVVYLGFFHFIRRHSILPFLSLFLLYVNIVPYQGMNRQLIAMVICLLSVKYLLAHQDWKFVFCVLFAMLFHTTAILFLGALLMRKQFSLKTYIVVLSLGVLVCLSGAMSYITSFSMRALGGGLGERVALYFGGEAFEASIATKMLGLLTRAIFVVPILYALYKKTRISKECSFFFNMFVVGCMFYMLLHGTIFQILVSRAALYFHIFQIVLIPYIVVIYRKAFTKASLLALLYVFFVFTMIRSIHNYDYGEYNPYIPYTTVGNPDDTHKPFYIN